MEEASSQDDLAAVTGISAGPPNMHVPPPFIPPGSKAGVGAVIKDTSTVLTRVETKMETNEQISSTSVGRPRVPLPTPAKPIDYVAPSQADKAGMRRWANDMLSGHPGGRATSFEQWGNSYVTQIKTVVDMMIQSLRIKEEAYSNMFNEHAKECTEADKSRREMLEEAQTLKLLLLLILMQVLN